MPNAHLPESRLPTTQSPATQPPATRSTATRTPRVPPSTPLAFATLLILAAAGCSGGGGGGAPAQPAPTFSVGGTLSGAAGAVVLQLNGANEVTVPTNGPFFFPSLLADESGFAVSVVSAPDGQTCTITNGTGTIAGADVRNVEIVCATIPSASVAYVANFSSDTVSAFRIDPASGDLAELGAAVATGDGPTSVVVDPTGRFAYVPNSLSGDVSAFRVDAVTGRLTSLGAPVPTGSLPESIAFDPTGRFAFVAGSGPDRVQTFAIDQVTGGLTQSSIETNGNLSTKLATDPLGRSVAAINTEAPVGLGRFFLTAGNGALFSAGVAVPAGLGPNNLALDPSGRFAFVTNAISSDVTSFQVAVSGVNYQAVDFTQCGLGPVDIAIDPLGRYAFAASTTFDDVTQFAIDPVTGDLLEFGNRAGVGTDPSAITVDPTGRFALVTNAAANTVSRFAIDQGSGFLTGRQDVSTGAEPRELTVSPPRRFAYVANLDSDSVSVYAIDPASGALTAVGADVPVGVGPRSVVVEPSGRFAYVANAGSDDVMTFAIDPVTGGLSQVGSAIPCGTVPFAAAVHPQGGFLYVASRGSTDVTSFRIDRATGVLTQIGTSSFAGLRPSDLQVDPSGRFGYATTTFDESGQVDDVVTLSIDQGTGVMTVATEVDGPYFSPRSVQVDPLGRFAFVVDKVTNLLGTYQINATTGALSLQSDLFVGFEARGLALHPSGRFAYLARLSGVQPLQIDPLTGLVSLIGSAIPAGTDTVAVSVDATGRFVYSTNASSDDVTTFAIDAATGALTQVGTATAAGTTPVAVSLNGGTR